MDRFIGRSRRTNINTNTNLKSNMDRFIVATDDVLDDVKLFKIQYG